MLLGLDRSKALINSSQLRSATAPGEGIAAFCWVAALWPARRAYSGSTALDPPGPAIVKKCHTAMKTMKIANDASRGRISHRNIAAQAGLRTVLRYSSGLLESKSLPRIFSM